MPLSLDSIMTEVVTVKDESFEYLFYDDSRFAKSRAETLFTKEEGTIRWIRAFHADSVFVDVGSNIGTYTIFAGKRVRSVYSFEPHLGNAYSLIRNVTLNQLDNVRVYSCALHDTDGYFDFHYSDLGVGSSLNQLDAEVIKGEKVVPPVATEQKAATTLDSLLERPHVESPDHVKIDVDGNELQILKGMARTLGKQTIKSLIVEFNPGLGEPIEGFMEEVGYRLAESQLTTYGKELHAKGTPFREIPHNSLYVRKQ